MRSFFVLLTLLCLPTVDRAQSDAAPPRQGRVVAQLERGGMQFPVLRTRDVLPADFTRPDIPGDATRRCVDAIEAPMMRAGDFIIGPLDRWLQSSAGTPSKVWWAPASAPTTLRVRVVSLSTSSERAYEYSGVAAVVGDSMRTFHPTTLARPASGRWALVATSGSSWGCVLLDIR